MMNKEMLAHMNKELKTNYVITALANIEMNTNKVFTNEELTQTIKRDEINQISRKDLNIEKVLMRNDNYNKFLDTIDTYCNKMKDGNCPDQMAEEILTLINKKYMIYTTVKNKFFN